MSSGVATWIEAGSAAIVGLAALGGMIGWVMRQANQRQTAHIASTVAHAIDTQLAPIKATVGEKNGSGDAMTMLARSLAETGQLLRAQERTAAFQQELTELSVYTRDSVHRLNGQVGMMWIDWAKDHGYDPSRLPPPAASPKAGS